MKINKYLIILLTALLVFTSCNDYLDVNDNPNKPSQATLSFLATSVLKNAGYTYSGDYYLGANLPSYVFYQTSREVDNYTMDASYSTLGNTWEQAYVYTLKDNEEVIKTAEATGNPKYAGIGRVVKAYLFSSMVDLWGDIPYSEFNNPDILQPHADNGASIYNALLSELDKAIEEFNDTDAAKNLDFVAGSDIIYGGDINKWIRLANTLKLKLLVNSRKAKADIADWSTQLSTLLAANDFIKNGEDFELKHTAQASPDERNPLFVSEYLGGQSTFYISPWIYETMSGLTHNVTTNPFEGIADPRIPYYWFNQITVDGRAQAETDYRDGAFVSIFFASNSGRSSSDQRNTSSFVGIYICGGRYDDGNGGSTGSSAGNGIAPSKMLQAYSVPFLLAELYLTGEATGDARAMLKEGMERSILHVNTVSRASVATVPVIDDTNRDAFVNRILAKYDAAVNNSEKLRIVMTQKWIANFGNSVEAYTDYRRTDYPVLLSSQTTQAISPYAHVREATLGPVTIPLKGLNLYPRALWYPNRTESSSNPNVSNSGRILSQEIVFWDK